MQHTHASPFAGRWYPADSSELSALISRTLDDSVCRRTGFVRPRGIAFVVPHAAPAYSGAVAAAVYRHVAVAAPRRIVLLGFSHRHDVPGIGVPAVDAISTPLGGTEIDVEALRFLDETAPFHAVAEDRLCDHSVEIQLPFLQTVAPAAKVAPLYVGHLSRSERFAAASELRKLLDGRTVFIASSDFTHYGSDFGYMPFALDDATPEHLKQLDSEMIASAGSLDPSLFLDDLRRVQSTVCGSEPIALLLEILRGIPGEEIFQETLDYQTSGEITSDYSHCVSYAGLGYFGESAFALSRDAQTRLMASARHTLDDLHNAGECPEFVPPYEFELGQRRGVFVTLYQHGELRGCIGTCRDAEPLWESVPRLTRSAAIEDRRFEALNEVERVDCEISVLTPFKRLRSSGDLIAGEHGAFLECGDHAGLLLPKVARERRWNSAKFLDALTLKAGLSSDVYHEPGARLFIFRAQVFGIAPRRWSAAAIADNLQ